MFEYYELESKTKYFNELSKLTEFEEVTKGRKGGVLVDYKDNTIPIIRTTSKYNKPSQKFLPIHYDIIQNIKKVTKNDKLEFNNALIEIYDSAYRTMKYHSDQALDMAEDSFICIFSCYDDPTYIRKLKIKNKTSGECCEISMNNNSIIIFSYEINYKHLHKIILDDPKADNKWLGITFRLSKTFIKFIDEKPYFSENGKLLRLANDDERKEFYKNRSKENIHIGYIYPDIDYTISVSDMLPIE